jgi:protein-S-isoprenylcysteine O-methyltransferase Ste14
MSFSEKWIKTTFNIVTGKRILRNVITPIGGVIFFSVMTGLIFISLYTDRLFHFKSFIPYPADLIIGLVFLIPGIVLAASCVIYFVKSKGTPVPFKPPPKLLIKGPYAFSRNPMLTGLFSVMFGIGIILNSVMLAFIVTPIFILLNVIERKKIEEPELIMRIGDEYIEYMKKVPMFIPGKKK